MNVTCHAVRRVIRRPSVWGLFVVATWLTACGSKSQGEHQRSRAILGAPDGSGAVAVESLLAVVRVDANTADLAPVSWLLPATGGGAYAAQVADGAVLHISSAGQIVRRIGRTGAGPGEFQFIARGGLTGDSLWVWDHTLRRMTTFGNGLDSNVVSMANLSVLLDPTQPRFGAAADGAVIPVARYSDGEMGVLISTSLDDDGVADRPGMTLLRVDSVGRVLRILMESPREAPESYVDVPNATSVPSSRLRVPLFPLPMIYSSPSGTWFATVTTDSLSGITPVATVNLVNSRGDTVFQRTMRFHGQVIDEATRQRALQFAERRLRRRAPDPGSILPQVRDALPHVHPPIGDVVISDNGWIYLKLWTPDGNTWLELNSEGQVTRLLVLPPRVHLKAIGQRQMWGLEVDENDLASVIGLQ